MPMSLAPPPPPPAPNRCFRRSKRSRSFNVFALFDTISPKRSTRFNNFPSSLGSINFLIVDCCCAPNLCTRFTSFGSANFNCRKRLRSSDVNGIDVIFVANCFNDGINVVVVVVIDFDSAKFEESFAVVDVCLIIVLDFCSVSLLLIDVDVSADIPRCRRCCLRSATLR
ncbi:hypothetical protein DERP_015390 [Dermatophagoides pteronyssinus]|uniref:Uncharacterized protein n=1 Tax=Dermatophagoides pteronyssinus TaxID=6956 RepID=A0ABQ8IRS9_DERPT|nr:hypothetical protein DERP_015390 [Dermatophagoides pteronyssinus]